MKKILSTIIASALVLATAASVCAADYAVSPDYKPPVTIRPSTQESKLPPIGTSLKNPQTLFTKDNVKDAVMNDEPVYASYKQADVKANAMAAIARVNMGRLTVITQRYTAVINSDTITEAKDISLAVKITKNSKKGAMIFRTEQQDDFGCRVDFTVAPKYYTQCNVDINEAHVYCIDTVTKKVTDMGEIKLDSSGNIHFSITAGGKYVIM